MPAGRSRRVQQYLMVLAVTWGASFFPSPAQALQRSAGMCVAGGPQCHGSCCLPLVFWVLGLVLRTEGLSSCCSHAGEPLSPSSSFSVLRYHTLLLFLSPLEHPTARHHPCLPNSPGGQGETLHLQADAWGWAPPVGGCPASVGASCSNQPPWGVPAPRGSWCIPPAASPRQAPGPVWGSGMPWQRDPPGLGWQPHGAGSCCHLEPPGWISQGRSAAGGRWQGSGVCVCVSPAGTPVLAGPPALPSPPPPPAGSRCGGCPPSARRCRRWV